MCDPRRVTADTARTDLPLQFGKIFTNPRTDENQQ